MRNHTFVVVLLFAALAAGCDAEPSGGGNVDALTVLDSAGVRIVENGAVPESGWRIAAEPLFTAGWDEGGAMFTWPQSGTILPGGGALVGEFAEGTIYDLGADGSVVDTWGRKGEGPGEFQGLDAILLWGDSILVSDGRLGRVTLLSPEGEVRTVPLPTGTLLPKVSAVFNDGRFLLVPGDGYGMVAETRPEWVFQTQPILTMRAAGGAPDTLAELPHLRQWSGSRGGSPGPVWVQGRAGGFAEGFAWARSDQREVRWYDKEGRLTQSARWDEEPTPVTPEFRAGVRRTYEEAYRAQGAQEAFVTAQLAELEAGFDRHEGPLPYWRQFFVDRAGNVWLGRYPRLGQNPEAWRVLARDGAIEGWVSLPGVLTILDITDDRILAVRRNELDVSAVVMLRLIKP